ncbi:hypothetical protein D3C73_1672720 [compost metagenome]
MVSDRNSCTTTVTASIISTITGTWPKDEKISGIRPSAMSPFGSSIFWVMDPP